MFTILVNISFESPTIFLTQLAGAIEYTDCISAKR